MANRTFNQFQGQLEKRVVDLYALGQVDASGQISIQVSATNGKGLLFGNSPTQKVSTGIYTLLLDDVYDDLLGLSIIYQSATGIAAAPLYNIIDYGVVGIYDGINQAKNVSFIRYTTMSSLGVLADPALFEYVRFKITLSNNK